MTCLVTGDRGFIGGHLIEYLAARGQDPIGFDVLQDYPTVEVLADFMKVNNVEEIYHLGARPFIPDCYGDKILSVVNSNVVFTANLLSACKKADVRKLLYFSTSEVYGTPLYIPVDEKQSINPQSTYAATKFASENLCRTFSKETGLDVVVMRQFNVYGPRDTWPRIIPKIMQAAKHDKLLKMGNADVIRDMTFVSDACEAALNIMKRETKEQIINHGLGAGYKISDMITVVERLYNKKISVVYNVEKFKRPWDVHTLICDRGLYDSIFKSAPTFLYDGIRYTKEWYDNHDWLWEDKETGE